MNPKILTTDTTFRSLVDVLSLIVTTRIYNKFCLLIIHTNIKLSQRLWQNKGCKDWPMYRHCSYNKSSAYRGTLAPYPEQDNTQIASSYSLRPVIDDYVL